MLTVYIEALTPDSYSHDAADALIFIATPPPCGLIVSLYRPDTVGDFC